MSDQQNVVRRISRLRFVPLPTHLLLDSGVGASAMRTWACLWAAGGGSERSTYRRKASLAEACGVSEATFFRHVATLKKAGYLEIETEPGLFSSTTYVVTDGPLPTLKNESGTTLKNESHMTLKNESQVVEARVQHPSGGASPQKRELPLGSDYEALFASYPGRKTHEARARYFSLARSTEWPASSIQQRLECFVRFAEALGWPLPTLANVLDPASGKLTDAYLEGLEGDAARAKRGPSS